MGFAKYYEDNVEILEERLGSMVEYSRDWNSERKYITRIINLPAETRDYSEDPNLKIRRYEELQRLHNSLQYRINIAYSAKDLGTELSKSATHAYYRNMENTLGSINRAINGYDAEKLKIVVPAMDEAERKQAKQIFIKQLAYQLLLAINNFQAASKESIVEIWQDIQKLIAWYFDDKKLVGGISGSMPDLKSSMQFLAVEMNYSLDACPACMHDSLEELEYCLICGKKKEE